MTQPHSKQSNVQKLALLCCIGSFAFSSLAQNIDIQLQGQRYALNQAANPQLSVLSIPSTLQIKLGQNTQFKQLSSTVYPGDIEFRFLTLGTSQGARVYDLLGWRAGTEADNLDDKTARELRAEAFFLDPQLLLSTAKNLQAIETPTEWQAQYQFESFTDQAGRPGTLVVDKQTRSIVSARSTNLTYLYAANTQAEKATHTSPMLTVKNGDLIVAQWDSVKLSALPTNNSNEFMAPNGYQDKAAIGTLRVETLAANTYRINGSASGYHMHFIIGENGIAVFDAPIFPNEMAQIKKLIEATAPGKTISHIVFSHSHRDHIGGSPQLVNEGTKIWAGKDGKLAIQRQLGDKLNALANEVVSEQIIDLGGRSIQLIPAPSSHASDMLLAYDAQSKILFQGDFFMMPEAGPAPVGFAVNRELQLKLKKLALTPERIVTVHGRVGTAAELDQTVKLLEAQELKQ